MSDIFRIFATSASIGACMGMFYYSTRMMDRPAKGREVAAAILLCLLWSMAAIANGAIWAELAFNK